MNEWSGQERSRVPGTKFQGTNGPQRERSAGFICSRERKFPGMNGPGNEWSRERKFHHVNQCSRERIVLRTNVPAFNMRTTSPIELGLNLDKIGTKLENSSLI